MAVAWLAGPLSGITELLVGAITGLMEQLGYPGLAFLMALESMLAPVPSEVVMPFAGFLVADGRMTLELAIVASSAGSLAGSLAGYAMGARLGRPAILRWGRYLFLKEDHLRFTERVFERYGDGVILVCRFVPVVRHLISIPAGMGRMRLPHFVVFTLVGATAWNVILLFVGIGLRERWREITASFELVDILVILALVGLAAWFVVSHLRERAARAAEAE